VILLLHSKQQSLGGTQRRNVLSKTDIRIRHTPSVLKNINSVRFCRVMKTVLILALIVAVCTCSVDASGKVKFGKEGEDSKPLSFREKKDVDIDQIAGITTLAQQRQDDLQDYNRLKKRLTENPKGELQEMKKRAKNEEGIAGKLLEQRLNEQEENPLISKDKQFFKRSVCRSLGLNEKTRYGTVKKAYNLANLIDRATRTSSESPEPPLFSDYQKTQLQKLFDIVESDVTELRGRMSGSPNTERSRESSPASVM
jgi:hypothetical protein